MGLCRDGEDENWVRVFFNKLFADTVNDGVGRNFVSLNAVNTASRESIFLLMPRRGVAREYFYLDVVDVTSGESTFLPMPLTWRRERICQPYFSQRRFHEVGRNAFSQRVPGASKDRSSAELNFLCSKLTFRVNYI